MRRVFRVTAILLGIGILVAAIPVAGVQLACRARTPPRAQPAPLMEQGDRRAEGDSYLTFPEWYIVYAYEDLAGVMRRDSESAFDYLAAITGFWSSLCGATRTASSIGPVTMDQTVTNHIIGLSFTAEMAIKGAWERTIGALAVLTRRGEKTEEDLFAQKVADDYAAFLHQTPWYRYPFGEKLAALWSEVPLSGAHMLRKLERRVALSLEWGGKALYAKGMNALAGYAPADLRIRSIVRAAEPADFQAIPQMTHVRDLGDRLVLVETPRYEAFTDILRQLSQRKRDVIEIAGNRRILTTIVAEKARPVDTGAARPIFTIPIQSKPGWQRVGLDTFVGDLTGQIAEVERQGARFEHAFDY